MNYSFCYPHICHLFSIILALLSWIDKHGADTNTVILKSQGSTIQCGIVQQSRNGLVCGESVLHSPEKGLQYQMDFWAILRNFILTL